MNYNSFFQGTVTRLHQAANKKNQPTANTTNSPSQYIFNPPPPNNKKNITTLPPHRKKFKDMKVVQLIPHNIF